jgi:heptosyltransferase-1
MAALRILVVRLSSMGDVIHTLPAARSLKASFPDSHLSWLVRPRWAPLLEGNPFIDEVITLERSVPAALRVARDLRSRKFDLAVDFQGLVQTALVASAIRPARLVGFAAGSVRERPAPLFYSDTVEAPEGHVVERNLQLAAKAGATTLVREFPLPEGAPEGTFPHGALPEGDFVLASPLAGWGSKQWPLEYWAELAGLLTTSLPMPLVINGPPSAERELAGIAGTRLHLSGIPGLIHATRRARAVIGVDSGPMHLAAALSKPGVAIFGPTDPQRNGPYGGSLRVLRIADAVVDYSRSAEPAASMRTIKPHVVAAALIKATAESVAESVKVDHTA